MIRVDLAVTLQPGLLAALIRSSFDFHRFSKPVSFPASIQT
jgi:hypothetical protein